jgi:hypothetical protein
MEKLYFHKQLKRLTGLGNVFRDTKTKAANRIIRDWSRYVFPQLAAIHHRCRLGDISHQS